MEFSRYLGLIGRLYFEGAISNFHPNLLRRFGGSLTLAGQDAQHVRVEENAFLWFDITRNPQELWDTAQAKWQRHSQAIRQSLAQGRTPSQAIYQYMRSHNTYPHTPTQAQQMLQPVMDETGSQHSAWMDSTIQFRRRVGRGARVMTDTFGALTTMAALMVTADNWQNATPAEWDRAMNAGEVGIIVGQMAGAHHDARSQWMQTHRDATARTR